MLCQALNKRFYKSIAPVIIKETSATCGVAKDYQYFMRNWKKKVLIQPNTDKYWILDPEEGLKWHSKQVYGWSG
jgi:hypothetical protein